MSDRHGRGGFQPSGVTNCSFYGVQTHGVQEVVCPTVSY
jgi:hypothetical protein